MTLVAAAAVAGSAYGASIQGVVVGSAHGTLLVASPSGTVTALQGKLAIGTRVRIDGAKATAIGRARTARIRGVVIRNQADLTFLSAASHVLVLHHTRGLASASDTSQPQPGSVVQTTVGIDDQGELDDQGDQELGQAQNVPIQATVAAVGTGTVTLTVNGQSLMIPLPAGLTLPSTIVGTTVTLNLSFAGSQAAASMGSDNQGDDDQQGDDNQGDLGGIAGFGGGGDD
jgi:hypothetical protein